MAKKKRKQTKKKLPTPPKVKKQKIKFTKGGIIVTFNMMVLFFIVVYGALSRSFGTLLVGFIIGFFATLINFQLVSKK